MKVVVAGATGYIGARVLRHLQTTAGIRVHGLARSACASGSSESVDFEKQPEVLAEALRRIGPEAVVNCVGTTSPDLRACVGAHVTATANLLAALAASAPGARLVQLGSAAEYGEAVRAPLSIREDTPPAPRGAYAVSKLAATLLALTHGPTLGLQCIGLRVFNLMGPGMSPGTIIPNVLGFLRQPGRASDDPIRLGPIGVHRDFVHIDDVVAAIVAALRAPQAAADKIFNIASGRAVLVRDLVRRLLEAAGHRGEIQEIASGSGRSAAVTWQRADIERARELLGWSPQRALEDSITELARGNG